MVGPVGNRSFVVELGGIEGGRFGQTTLGDEARQFGVAPPVARENHRAKSRSERREVRGRRRDFGF